MAQIEAEQAIAENLPSGFKNTFLEEDRLRRLTEADTGVLGETVTEYSGNTLTENDVINSVADRILTSYLTPERTIEFPGLALSLSEGLLEQFAAKYKADNDTPSGTIKDAARAGTDDIVFEFASPEVWSIIANGDLTGPDTFQQSGLTGGDTLELIGQGGIDETTNTSGNSLQLDADEYLFLTGDFIDLSEGKSVVTKVQLADVDGEDFGPIGGLFPNRLSGSHLFTAQGTYATSTIDVDAKVYENGDAEIVPIAFYMGPGTKSPGLV